MPAGSRYVSLVRDLELSRFPAAIAFVAGGGALARRGRLAEGREPGGEALEDRVRMRFGGG